MHANCLTYLNRATESEQEWRALLKELELQFKHDGNLGSGMDSAVAFANFGGALADEGRLTDAVVNLKAAKNILVLLFVEHKTQEVAVNLASTLTRLGDALADLRDYSGAMAEYNNGEDLYKLFCRPDGTAPLGMQIEYAHLLGNRSTCLVDMNEVDRAINDVNSAISIQTDMIEQKGHPELTDALAMSLANRAALLGIMGNDKAAVQDADRAIAILRKEISENERLDLRTDLAYSLKHRAQILGAREDFAESSANYVEAIEILVKLVNSGESGAAESLVDALTGYGKMLLDVHNSRRIRKALVEAESALTEAKLILTRLVEGQDRRELEPSMATVLNLRGAVLGRQRKWKEADIDIEAAIAIYLRLKAADGLPGLRQRYATCLMNHAITKYEDGGDRAAIMQSITQAIDIDSKLVAEGEVAVNVDLSIALATRARILQNTGHEKDAIVDLDEAIHNIEKSIAAGRKADSRYLPRLKRQREAAVQGKKFSDDD